MNLKMSLKLITLLIIISMIAGCIQGGGATRGYVKDYSVTTTSTSVGCGTSKYIIFTSDYTSYSCVSSCTTGYHSATSTEITTFTDSASTLVKSYYTGSKGMCIADSAATRPTGEVYVANNFCSCLSGKPDIINDCDSYCASITSTTTPTLHGSVTLGSSIANNTKLGNLANWCNVQLETDSGTPGCILSAWDGTNTIETTVNVKSDNTFTADLTSLAYNTTYVVKIVEAKSGSNAASTEFQIRRVKQSTSTDTGGAIKVAPISQYSCLQYGGTTNSSGVITRTSYARVYYYFPATEEPAPIPSSGGTNQSQIVCHDEIEHPGTDNALYPRLELIPSAFTLWDKTDSRFVKTNNVMNIVTTIQNRLSDEYGVTSSLGSLFTLLQYPNRPNVTTSSSTTSSTSTATGSAQGYMMVPFINSSTNLAYCPTSTQYTGSDAIFRILKDYLPDTEGLFLGEKEAETIATGSSSGSTTYQTIYGTMFVTQSILETYGFYVQNGLKVKASASSLHNKTIYYYWPTSDSMDPLTQGDRKLFTVRYYDQLNGNTPTGVDTSQRTSDKRIGCVPKS